MHRGKVDPEVSELPRGNELSRDHVKLHHLKIVPKFSICKKFYRKALPFETNSFQSLANFNVTKNENVCVVVPLMDNIKYCCYISIKKFAICDI